MKIDEIINKLEEKISLSLIEAKEIFNLIMNGEIADEKVKKILVLLSIKGESIEEITGGALVLRDKCKHVNIQGDAIDTCGTGGDGKNTINISTAVAIILADLGFKVAKHGNKGISSKSGSADVLEKLNININKDPDQIEEGIKNKNFGFMFAPNYHSAMKNVAHIRKELKQRTIFNLLGPLSNPAKVNHQCIGVFSKDILKKYIEVLKNLKLKKAWVFHSNDGMDEISLFDRTEVYELDNGKIRNFTIDPKIIEKENGKIDDIIGQEAEYNSNKIKEIFDGKTNTLQKIVSLNTAAALIVLNKFKELKDAYNFTKKHLETGSVAKYLKTIQE